MEVKKIKKNKSKGITTMGNILQDNLSYFLWCLCLLRTESTRTAYNKEAQLSHIHPYVCFQQLPASYGELLGGSCGCSRGNQCAWYCLWFHCCVRILEQVRFIFVSKSSAKRKQLCSVLRYFLMFCWLLLGAVILRSLQ